MGCSVDRGLMHEQGHRLLQTNLCVLNALCTLGSTLQSPLLPVPLRRVAQCFLHCYFCTDLPFSCSSFVLSARFAGFLPPALRRRTLQLRCAFSSRRGLWSSPYRNTKVLARRPHRFQGVETPCDQVQALDARQYRGWITKAAKQVET